MMPTLDNIIAAGVKPDVAAKWLAPIQVTCEKYQINTKQRIAGFLSQCAHESGGFTLLEENLNYRAATLAACWPNRFAELGPDKKPKRDPKGALIPTKVALSIEKKPELIANMVYSSRMGNGPAESGDGFAFIGRGLKQLTGKDNYTRCGKALEVDFVSNPKLLLEPKYASLSAGWFWSANKCDQFADSGDIQGLTKRINGGLIGLSDRQARYEKCLASFSE